MSRSKSVKDRVRDYIKSKSPERFTVQELVEHFSFNCEARGIKLHLEKLLSEGVIKSENKPLPNGITPVYFYESSK